jgi:NADH-quinone oxidoreductase subunit N
MPPAAVAPVILVLAAVLLLLGAGLTQLHRIGGMCCLFALTLAGCGLSFATNSFTEPTPHAASADDSANEFDTAEIELDSFSLTVCWAALGLGCLLTLSSMQVQPLADGLSERYAGLLLAIAGLMLVGLARDLIVLALSLELIALPTLLAWVAERSKSTANEAAAKLLLLGLLSTGLLWFGIAILYGITGTTHMPDCMMLLAGGHSAVEPASLQNGTIGLGLPAAVLILAGLAMRMRVAPFHFGSPELTDATTVWQAALPATIATSASIIAAWRLFGQSWNGLDQTVVLMLMVVAVVSMTVGAVMACAQNTVRRLLAYTAMAHAGFALLGVTVGAAAGFFYLGGYVLAISGVFAVLCYLSRRDRDVEYIDDLSGLVRSEPIAAGCAGVCLLSLAGLPPLPLFWGNLLLLVSAPTAPNGMEPASLTMMNGGFVAIVALAAISSLLLASVYLQLVATMFLKIQVGQPRPAGGQTALAAAVLAATLTLGMGLLPGPLLEHLEQILHAAK